MFDQALGIQHGKIWLQLNQPSYVGGDIVAGTVFLNVCLYFDKFTLQLWFHFTFIFLICFFYWVNLSTFFFCHIFFLQKTFFKIKVFQPFQSRAVYVNIYGYEMAKFETSHMVVVFRIVEIVFLFTPMCVCIVIFSNKVMLKANLLKK